MNCRDCVYFNEDDELHCAVNPLAAKSYEPDCPNDCNDFHLASHQDSSTDFSLNHAQTWLTEQRQQFDAYQRQLASSSEQVIQLRSETYRVQSEIHRLSIQLHQLKCEQVELENKFSELQVGSQGQAAKQKQLEHLQPLVTKFHEELSLMEAGKCIFLVSIAFSMIMLSFNHRLMANCAIAFGFGATTLSYGYALYPRKPQ